jgi:hypothetical protein
VNGKFPLVFLLISSTASLSAAPLTRPERDYIAMMTLSVGVTNMCGGYDVDDANVLRFADSRHQHQKARLRDVECDRGDCRRGLRQKRPHSRGHPGGSICFGHDDPRCIEIGKNGRLRPVWQAADQRRFPANKIEVGQGPSIAAGWSKPTTSGAVGMRPPQLGRPQRAAPPRRAGISVDNCAS